MKITLDLSELEIKAMHNAAAALSHEASSLYLGCDSWMRDAFVNAYPDKNPFEIEDMVIAQAKAMKDLVIKIEEQERGC